MAQKAGGSTSNGRDSNLDEGLKSLVENPSLQEILL